MKHVSPHVCVAVAIVAALVSAAPTDAACIEGEAEVVWSLPADGDVDVPANAQIWVITTLLSRDLLVEVDGIVAQRGTGEVAPFDPGLLPAGAHNVDVSVLETDGTSSLILSFTFTSTDSVEAVNAAPALNGIERRPSRELSETCARALASFDCFDSGQDTHFVVDARAAPAYVVAASRREDGVRLQQGLWPGDCGPPELFLASRTREVCIGVATVGLAGMSPVTTLCEPLAEQSNGCAQTQPSMLGLLALALLAVRVRFSP